MRRAIFAREFRSALLPNLVTVGAILATLMILQWIYSLRLGEREEISTFIDVALLAGLAISGFISGERCFPSEMKEFRIFFLSSLPISRSWIWFSIVSARLLAALLSIFFAVALRGPSIVLLKSMPLRPKIGLIAGLVLFACILFFSAGSLFALLIRRILYSYIVGLTALGILLVETVLSCNYLGSVPSVVFANPTQIPEPNPQRSIPAFLSLLLASSLLGSWRLFTQGEIGNPKRRTRNQILFGMAVAAYLCTLFCVMANPSLVSAGSDWRVKFLGLGLDDSGIPYSVSPDGRYLAVSEFSGDRPFLFRVTIVDTQTGRILGRSFFGGVIWVYWSNSGDILNLVALNNSPLDRWGYLKPATVDWVRLSPDAQEISRRRLRGAKALAILAGGRSLAVSREGDQGRIDLLDGASGRSSEIARASLDGDADITTNGPTALVYFKNTVLPSKAWLVDSIAHEVRLPRSAPETRWVLFGDVSRNPSEAQFVPGVGQGYTILPHQDQLWVLYTGPDVNEVYFLVKNDSSASALWALSTAPGGRWEELPDLASYLTSPDDAVEQIRPLIDFPSGVAAFPAGESDGSFFVYDPRIGVIREAGSCPRGNQVFLNLNRPAGLKGLLIRLICGDDHVEGRTHYFEYVPGSRKVRAIKTVDARLDFSSHLYFDERGSEVWVTYDGNVWSSAPGKGDLLLWRGQQDPSP